ncbi:hypothetical protein EON76_06965 [bacterium]|nr:MAG: hypothetical protein EON76_06965 [bacterium]
MASSISRIGGNGSINRDTASAGHDAVQREHDKQFATAKPQRNAKVDEVAKMYEKQFLGRNQVFKLSNFQKTKPRRFWILRRL